jgi:hypothetical protein
LQRLLSECLVIIPFLDLSVCSFLYILWVVHVAVGGDLVAVARAVNRDLWDLPETEE